MRTTLIVVFSAVLAMAVGYFWGKSATRPPFPLPSVASQPVQNKPAAASALRAASVSQSNPYLAVDWRKLKSVRDLTLQKDPALEAEYKALLAEMEEDQKQLEAAMMKADPKVAPAIARLSELRRQNHPAH